MKRIFIILLIVVCLNPIYSVSHGEIAVFDIQGTIWTVIDSKGYINGAVQIGDTFTGTIVYDLSLVDSDINPNVGNFTATLPPNGMAIVLKPNQMQSISQP